MISCPSEALGADMDEDKPEFRIPSISEDVIKRIWGDDATFRLFLSHKAEVKSKVASLQEELGMFGISSFVAHKDIEPTLEWQNEIENALSSMDGFVALMTDKFHESNWTDQEVGFAFARGVPIVAVRLGRDPYGFIGKFQGLTANWGDSATELTKLLSETRRSWLLIFAR